MKVIPLFLFFIFTLGIFSSSAQPDDVVTQRPNIIFLLTDDQRDDSTNSMGHPWVKTPHLDHLVDNGVRFTNTYIAAPVCSPSRVSYFTGMLERTHGVGFSSTYALNDTQWEQTYPALLRKSGYFTGFIGKFGLEYYTFIDKADEKFDFWYAHNRWAKFYPKEPPLRDHLEIYQDAKADLITEITGEGIANFLDAVPEDQPFCLSVSFSTPHGSQAKTMGAAGKPFHEPANLHPKIKDHPIYGDLYRDIDIAIPDAIGSDPYVHIPKAIMDQDRGRNNTYKYDYDRESAHEHHIRYYQMITGIDKVVGDLVAQLEDKGLSDNTIIIFTSDHGLIMGEYGMGGKSLLYDLSAKVPCFIYDPRLSDDFQGTSRDALVSSIDLTSTILDYAGVEQPEMMEGKSLVPLIKNESTEWREHLFLESLFTLRDNPFCEGIRKGQWKYIRMYDGVNPYTEADIDFSDREPEFEQLFDLGSDPQEVTNLIDQYEGSELLEELRDLCAKQSVERNQRRADYREAHKITLSLYKSYLKTKQELKMIERERDALTKALQRLEKQIEKEGRY